MRCDPLTAVAKAMSAGEMKEATFPESAKRPKASVARSGVVWRTIMVREAACSAPPAAPINAPSTFAR